MAQTIKLKRSAVAARVPLTTDIALGELAINTYDGKMYFKKDSGTASIVRLANIGEVVDLSTNQAILGQKTFSDYAFFGEDVLLNNSYSSVVQKSLRFRSHPSATIGGKIVFGADFASPYAAQSGIYGSIENLKVPTTDYEAANKKYVDDQVALKANLSHTHAASDITSGTISTARLGSGTANNTTFLRGDNTWATVSGSGSVVTDTIWDAKGDLAIGTGADTASKLTVGANGTILMADSSQTTGVKWASMPSSFDFGTITTPADFTLDLGTI